MKKIVWLLLIIVTSYALQAQTTDEWLRQDKTQIKYLAQQIAKLQVYLGYIRKGYNIDNKGLSTISSIKNGDFNLHTDFFDHLKLVSPIVKKYSKAADIIVMQKKMLSVYRDYYKQFRESGVYTLLELDFIYKLLSKFLEKAASCINDLSLVLTDSKLEMKDEERLKIIDRLYLSMDEHYRVLLSFCQKTKIQYLQRMTELEELKHLKKLY